MNTGNKKVRKVKNVGTVYYDNVKDKWVGQVEIGTYDNGRTKYKRFYSDSQDRTIQKMRDYKANNPEIININSDNSELITKDFFKYYIQTIKKGKLKPASYTRELGTFNNHIEPYIGNYKLIDLTTKILQAELINTLVARGYSYSTIHKAYVLTNECLRYAHQQEIIPKNPFEFVEKPSKKALRRKQEIRFLDDKEIKIFIQTALQKHKYTDTYVFSNGLAVVSLIYTGLRVGEFVALKWKDIDFRQGFIRIHSNIAVAYDDNGVRHIIVQESTKTRNSRIVYLTKSAKKYLTDLKKMNNPKDDDYVNNPNGTRDISYLEGSYKAICKRANITNYGGIHTLRHTFASLMIRNGVDIKIISEMLGHASVSFTYNTYVHLIEEEKAKTISQINI